MQEAHEPVALGDAAQGGHEQLLVIRREVRALEQRRDLELPRRHLVVTGLDRDAELEQLLLDLDHVREHALGDHAEVLVFELLALRRLGAEQRATSRDQVRTCEVELAIDEEVLLLGTTVRNDLGDLLVPEQLEDARGLLVQSLHRAQERGLLVERLARPRHERGRDAERGVVDQIGRARDVPGGVAASFEGGADAAARKARSVGLALNEGLARELGERAAVTVRNQEAVVLFRGRSGERIEDVRVVGGAFGRRPVLHGSGDHVGHRGIELRALLDGSLQGAKHVLGQVGLHLGETEDARTEELINRSTVRLRRTRETARNHRRHCLLT